MSHLTSRRVAISRTGRYVVVARGGALDIVDALGTSPRVRIVGDTTDFACVGAMLWRLSGSRIDRFVLATGRPIEPAIELAEPARTLLAERGEGAHHAVAIGDTAVLALGLHDRVATNPLGATRAFPIGGARTVVVDGPRAFLSDGRRRDLLRTSGDIVAVHALFAGRALAIVTREAAHDVWLVVRPDGTRIHELAAPRATSFAVGGDRGTAIVAAACGAVLALDLRYGTTRARGTAPFPILDLDVSCDGHHITLAGATGDTEVVHLAATQLFAYQPAAPEVPPIVAEKEPVDARATEAPPAEPISPPAPERTPFVPLALGAPLPLLAAPPAPGAAWPAYASAREHLDDMLDLVATRAARRIAEAWNSGRLTTSANDRAPFEREVRALLGHVPGFAPHALGETGAQLAQLAERNAGRLHATIVAGRRLPFVELMRELDLSPTAGHILMVALAPALRGEIARLFGILANDAGRPLVDHFLIETVLAGADRARRAEVAAELAPDAPLRRHGILHAAGDPAAPMFQSLTVDPVALARLSGRGEVAAPALPFDALVLAGDAARELQAATSRPRGPGDPLRLVLRGRRGAGRRSIVAALAAQVGRDVGHIACSELPRAGIQLAAALQRELARMVMRGCIPIISELEGADASDVEGQDRLRQVLRTHPGPIVIRSSPEASLPLAPGFISVTLPPLSETERRGVWLRALERAGLACARIDELAARWRVGPGIIEHVVARVAAQREAGDASDASSAIHAAAHQHVAARLGHVATPVRRLAAWEDVALADDVIDSIREFIGRVAHRRTVFETWGFDGKVASARGLTALFYGPPGTGKSMVAGLVARELGLELYRVDLSRVVSKWIGETEKNLAEVFDAAEDGQAVILFDEADSLFARRTEVKTSVDRYANLEVNYLLQRLDSFEGVAILTTNLDGSIDPAFKRRMSLRLQFPFPDEDMRKRLWASHIPADAPVRGDFDFGMLARKFPLSGGYIRNSTLRAAFLAAQERVPLGQAHLLRAIALEYRELGKLAGDGRME